MYNSFVFLFRPVFVGNETLSLRNDLQICTHFKNIDCDNTLNGLTYKIKTIIPTYIQNN